MRPRKISFYYQKFSSALFPTEDIAALIDLHCASFREHGWEPVHVDDVDARRHPLYAVFDDPHVILNPPGSEYIRSCYMRWLAYAVHGHPFSDLDVINYGFTPRDADALQALNTKPVPLLLSGAGAMGLLTGADYDALIKTFTDFIERPVIEGPIAVDIHDLNILAHHHADWFDVVPHNDPRFVKDYTGPGWEEAKLVHYPYHFTAPPRAETIQRVRPFKPEPRKTGWLGLSGILRSLRRS